MTTNEFNAKMEREQSHMEPIKAVKTPPPSLVECVRDLLKEIDESKIIHDPIMIEVFDRVIMAAERVEAALEYDTPRNKESCPNCDAYLRDGVCYCCAWSETDPTCMCQTCGAWKTSPDDDCPVCGW